MRTAFAARGGSTGRLAAGAAFGVALVLIARVVRRTRLELADYRRRDRTLGLEWTHISMEGRHLRLHSRRGAPSTAAHPHIVLVHGYGIAGSYLVPLASALARQATVWIPDLPGHGRSDHAPHPLTVKGLADALGIWMDAVKIRTALAVGHSLGAQIVAELAVKRPDLVAGLVLMGPTSDSSARTIWQTLARAARTACFERPSFFIWGALDYSRAGIRVLAHELRQLVVHHVEDALPDVSAPVLVIRGSRDYIAPQRWANLVARVAAADAPVVIDRAAHAAHYTDPDGVGEAIALFAGGLRS